MSIAGKTFKTLEPAVSLLAYVECLPLDIAAAAITASTGILRRNRKMG
jgi:hypothetical protein